MEPRLTQQTDFVPLARKLGVRVETPFLVRHGADTVRFDAYLPDFGGTTGMVILLEGDLGDFDRMCSVAEAAGLYFSALNGDASTSESDVKATLDDWGFYGPAQLRLAWYTGGQRPDRPPPV